MNRHNEHEDLHAIAAAAGITIMIDREDCCYHATEDDTGEELAVNGEMVGALCAALAALRTTRGTLRSAAVNLLEQVEARDDRELTGRPTKDWNGEVL
jgi:hypothetical protein